MEIAGDKYLYEQEKTPEHISSPEFSIGIELLLLVSTALPASLFFCTTFLELSSKITRPEFNLAVFFVIWHLQFGSKMELLRFTNGFEHDRIHMPKVVQSCRRR